MAKNAFEHKYSSQEILNRVFDDTNNTLALAGNAGAASATVGASNADYITDGVADEVQINAAIAAVNAAGGGKVKIKPGTFVAAADVLHLDNVVVEGEGEASNVTFPVNGTRWYLNHTSNAKCLNFKIDASAQPQDGDGITNLMAMRLNGVTNIEIAGMHILTIAFGIFTISDDTNATNYVYIHHNYIRGACGNDLIGGGPIDSAGLACQNVIVESNVIIQDKTMTDAGVYYTAMDMVRVNQIKFIDNICYGNILFGDEQDPNSISIVSRNHVTPPVGTTTVGAKIKLVDDVLTTATSGRCIISNNILYGGSIEIIGKSDGHIVAGVISGNIILNDATFVSYTQHGINLTYADEFNITGNQCLFINGANTGTDGIVISNSLNCNVVGNTFDGYAVGMQGVATTSNHTLNNNYIVNCTATVGSALLTSSGTSMSNNWGINPNCAVKVLTSSSGAVTLDRKDGDVFTITLTENTTLTLSTTRVPTGSTFRLIITNHASAPKTWTWPSNFKKAGGALTITAGNSAVDVIEGVYDGTNWREVARSLNQS